MLFYSFFFLIFLASLIPWTFPLWASALPSLESCPLAFLTFRLTLGLHTGHSDSSPELSGTCTLPGTCLGGDLRSQLNLEN